MERIDYQLIIISDLHLSEGWDPKTKKLSRNEDFFFDLNFQRFLQHLARRAERGGFHYKLIINGDFVDFLQFMDTPDAGTINGEKITYREKELGLGTSLIKTLWKLDILMNNHWIFFYALKEFVQRGNELYIIPGNHDIEWVMPEVQKRFIKKLSRGISEDRKEGFKERVRFSPWFYYDPNLSVFVEHGHQYDPLNSFDYYLYPFRKDGTIELPAGSFFVRYLFNRVESDYPFADNMKPISKFIIWAFFRLEMWFSWPPKVIKFVRFFVDILGKVHPIDKDWKQRVELSQNQKLRELAQASGLDLEKLKATWSPSAIHQSSWWMLFNKFLANTKLSGAYYSECAKDIHNLFGVRYVVFGHTHDADIRLLTSELKNGQPEYVNSGTWTKTFAENHEEALLKGENEFVFVHIKYDDVRADTKMELLRWNDAIGEGERVRLFADKIDI